MAAPFTGIGVALVTLFDDTKALDEKGTADLAARLVDDGVSAVVVSGSTGEADTLEDDERRRLLDAVRSRVDGVPVLAGTGGTWAGQAARRTAAARDGGADAALVLSPRRTADVRAYYAEVAAAAGALPLLAYHFPTVSAPGIPVEVLPELPVIGAKDSSGDPERLLRELSTWDGHLYPGAVVAAVVRRPARLPGRDPGAGQRPARAVRGRVRRRRRGAAGADRRPPRVVRELPGRDQGDGGRAVRDLHRGPRLTGRPGRPRGRPGRAPGSGREVPVDVLVEAAGPRAGVTGEGAVGALCPALQHVAAGQRGARVVAGDGVAVVGPGGERRPPAESIHR